MAIGVYHQKCTGNMVGMHPRPQSRITRKIRSKWSGCKAQLQIMNTSHDVHLAYVQREGGLDLVGYSY